MLHKALKIIRQYHEIKQVELAVQLGISKSFLSEVESGKKAVSLELLNKYAEIFEVPASSLVFFSESIERKGVFPDKFRQVIAGKILDVMVRIPVKLNSDSGICEHHFRKVCGQGFFEQKLSFEGRHLFDSLNKPAAKRSAAVVDPRRWNRTVHLTSEYVH